MAERKKILWLVSWYPNKYNPFDGDFVQRHARAAALYHDVQVLFVTLSEKQEKKEETIARQQGLTERIVYLPKEKGLRGRLQNYRRWKLSFREAIAQMVAQEKPALVHVHVPWKAGLVALWAKQKFGLPYIVTEHWGIYNTVADDNIHARSFLFRRLLKRVYKEASAFISVSKFLGEGVNKTLTPKPFSVVPNVVDTSLFFPSGAKHERFTFLHVSNMVPLKNVEGILEAFKRFLQASNADAQLVLVGNENDGHAALAAQMGLSSERVSFRGVVPYGEVAKAMQQSHAFVLNSYTETFGCVVAEALCCGLPVIATSVGGVPELVNEGNGVLVPPNDDRSLSAAMKFLVDNYRRYDTEKIASAAKKKFSFTAVGAAFASYYTGSNHY